jgi:hypothetical protein
MAKITLPDGVFTLHGHKVQKIAPTTLLRDDRMVGTYPVHSKEVDPAEIRWYTVAQIAERASRPAKRDRSGAVIREAVPVTVPMIVQRLKARWRFADLIKPLGWERVVECRTVGLPYEARLVRFDELRGMLGLSTTGLINRLANTNISELTLFEPARSRRAEVPPGAEVPDTVPRRRPAPGARFYFRGAIDTLNGHCRAHKVLLQTVRARLDKFAGITLEEAFAKGRRTRSDKGKPNPKRGEWRRDLYAMSDTKLPTEDLD